MRVLGRLVMLAGVFLLIYSQFVPMLVVDVETSQKFQNIVLPLKGKLESSLFALGGKLSELNEAEDIVKGLPKHLNYLWAIFVFVALLNLVAALMPFFPRFLRLLIALIPAVLLGSAVYSAATNPKLHLGLSGLLKYFSQGFYVMVVASLLILLGAVMTVYKRA